MANMTGSFGNIDSALIYFKEARRIFIQERRKFHTAMTMTSIAGIYTDKGLLSESEKELNEARKIFEETNNLYGLGMCLMNLGKNATVAGKQNDAIAYFERAYRIHLERKDLLNLRESTGHLSELFRNQKKFKNAHEWLRLHAAYKDSVLNENTNKQILELEAKFENEKNARELALKNLLLENSYQEIRQKKNNLILVFISLTVLFLGLSFFAFRQFYQKKKFNALLLKQNEEILQKSAELEQTKLIEQKNKDVTDSIKYARHIQNGIMPPEDLLHATLGEHFILYLPKDIVSGDFYWIKSMPDQSVWFSVVDCTGHGVPGAFMSVLAHAAMNSVISKFNPSKPGIFLNFLSDTIKETFRHSTFDSDIQDGMDLSLCQLDRKQMKLNFAGAKNPVVVVRKGQLIEIRGDKQYLSGKSEQICTPFATHEVALEKGDWIYLFSDGYADQFGGPKGKKFKYSNLKNMLNENAGLSAYRQKEKLSSILHNWKGELEQIDDILVMGIKV
jgi:serine phosphatase RsbU (regulator of sigma subunit)